MPVCLDLFVSEDKFKGLIQVRHRVIIRVWKAGVISINIQSLHGGSLNRIRNSYYTKIYEVMYIYPQLVTGVDEGGAGLF